MVELWGDYNPLVKGWVQTSVWVKGAWADDWEFVPYLQALNATESCAPAVSHAEFRYEYGLLKRPDWTAWDRWYPLALRGAYVQILAHSPWDSWPVWVGKIERETLDLANASQWAQGRQECLAYGLEHELDRIELRGAITDAGATNGDVVFNRSRFAGLPSSGNRSASVAVNGAYYFSTAGYSWTNLQIAEYVLASHVNPYTGGLQWVVTGARDALDAVVGEYDLTGMTAREALNRLVDRKRGLGWRIVAHPSGGNVEIYVFSLTDVAVQGAGLTIPANPEQCVTGFGDVIGAQASVTYDDATVFDWVVARGDAIYVAGSFSKADGTLEDGWTTEEQSAYDAEEEEPARSAEKYRSVYQKLVVPAAWGWAFGDGAGGTQYGGSPEVLQDGTLNWSGTSNSWVGEKVFERSLPWLEGGDSAQRGQAPLLAWLWDGVNSRWWPAPVLNVGELELPTVNVRPSDTELAVYFETRVNHTMGYDHFLGDSLWDATYDYAKTIVTAMVRTDARLEVVRRANRLRSWETQRTKVIRVPNATVWAVMPGTVYDIDGTGLARFTELNYYRDDTAYVQAIAALAGAWYGRPRAAVTIRVEEVLPVHRVGSMIRAIAGPLPLEVGTAVTSRSWDFRAGTMEVTTSFVELDFVGAG